jgi:hypothetical protein
MAACIIVLIDERVMLGYEVEEVDDFMRIDIADVIVLYGLLEDGLENFTIGWAYFSRIDIDEPILVVLDGGLGYIHGQVVFYWEIQ